MWNYISGNTLIKVKLRKTAIGRKNRAGTDPATNLNTFSLSQNFCFQNGWGSNRKCLVEKVVHRVRADFVYRFRGVSYRWVVHRLETESRLDQHRHRVSRRKPTHLHALAPWRRPAPPKSNGSPMSKYHSRTRMKFPSINICIGGEYNWISICIWRLLALLTPNFYNTQLSKIFRNF